MPLKVVYLDDYLPIDDKHQQKMIDDFIGDFSSTLSAQLLKFSLTSLWKETKPSGVGGTGLEDYLNEVFTWIYFRG